MNIENKAMLITYADSLGQDVKELREVLDKYLDGVISGIHLLPFYPSSGDRGFAPMDYTKVDPKFGNWDDIMEISKNHYMMYDFMINHISKESPYFQDFLRKKDKSKYADLFISYDEFWPENRPTKEDIDLIYKRKPRAPYLEVSFEDGTTDKLWCTFDEQQIDLDVTTDTTKKFIKDNLTFLTSKGANIIRLDAFAYANKKIGTNCFFVEPEIWNLLAEVDSYLPNDIELLPEIHEHYTIQQKIAEQDYYVYDFALPMLVLHALYSGKADKLKYWLEISPKKQFTTLDTHDGIGVVDVKDLLTDEEIELTKESLYRVGANVKKIYSTEVYNNLDIYQINCTYYSALGNEDNAYLLARALQVFAPGIPQIYYVGLLAGENDIDLLEKTKEGRNINRHYYSLEEVHKEVERPVVKKLFNLLKFRNSCPAFDGDIRVEQKEENQLIITWTNEEVSAQLNVDLKEKSFTIVETTDGSEHEIVV